MLLCLLCGYRVGKLHGCCAVMGLTAVLISIPLHMCATVLTAVFLMKDTTIRTTVSEN